MDIAVAVPASGLACLAIGADPCLDAAFRAEGAEISEVAEKVGRPSAVSGPGSVRLSLTKGRYRQPCRLTGRNCLAA